MSTPYWTAISSSAGSLPFPLKMVLQQQQQQQQSIRTSMSTLQVLLISDGLQMVVKWCILHKQKTLPELQSAL
jgi:hypothetical protein